MANSCRKRVEQEQSRLKSEKKGFEQKNPHGPRGEARLLAVRRTFNDVGPNTLFSWKHTTQGAQFRRMCLFCRLSPYSVSILLSTTNKMSGPNGLVWQHHETLSVGRVKLLQGPVSAPLKCDLQAGNSGCWRRGKWQHSFVAGRWISWWCYTTQAEMQ